MTISLCRTFRLKSQYFSGLYSAQEKLSMPEEKADLFACKKDFYPTKKSNPLDAFDAMFAKFKDNPPIRQNLLLFYLYPQIFDKKDKDWNWNKFVSELFPDIDLSGKKDNINNFVRFLKVAAFHRNKRWDRLTNQIITTSEKNIFIKIYGKNEKEFSYDLDTIRARDLKDEAFKDTLIKNVKHACSDIFPNLFEIAGFESDRDILSDSDSDSDLDTDSPPNSLTTTSILSTTRVSSPRPSMPFSRSNLSISIPHSVYTIDEEDEHSLNLTPTIAFPLKHAISDDYKAQKNMPRNEDELKEASLNKLQMTHSSARPEQVSRRVAIYSPPVSPVRKYLESSIILAAPLYAGEGELSATTVPVSSEVAPPPTTESEIRISFAPASEIDIDIDKGAYSPLRKTSYSADSVVYFHPKDVEVPAGIQPTSTLTGSITPSVSRSHSTSSLDSALDNLAINRIQVLFGELKIDENFVKESEQEEIEKVFNEAQGLLLKIKNNEENKVSIKTYANKILKLLNLCNARIVQIKMMTLIDKSHSKLPLKTIKNHYNNIDIIPLIKTGKIVGFVFKEGENHYFLTAPSRKSFLPSAKKAKKEYSPIETIKGTDNYNNKIREYESRWGSKKTSPTKSIFNARNK